MSVLNRYNNMTSTTSEKVILEKDILKATEVKEKTNKNVTHKDIPGLDLPFDYQNMETLSIEQSEMFDEALVCKLSNFRAGYKGIHDFIQHYMEQDNFPYKEDKDLLMFYEHLSAKKDKDKPFTPKEWVVAMLCYLQSEFWTYNKHCEILKETSYSSLQMDVFNKPRQEYASCFLIDIWNAISKETCPQWLINFYKSFTEEIKYTPDQIPDIKLKVNGKLYQYLYDCCLSVYLENLTTSLEKQAASIEEMIAQMPPGDEDDEEEEYRMYQSSDDEGANDEEDDDERVKEEGPIRGPGGGSDERRDERTPIWGPGEGNEES